MADDIRIGIKVTGTESVIAATNKTLSLESSVKKLSAAYSRDSVKYGAYRKGINELAAAYNKTDAELRKYANSLRATKTADEKAKAASKALKDELRAMTAMRREANEMNNRYNREQAIAAQKVKDTEKAASKALKDELRALTAVRREANEMNRRYDDTLRASIATERAAAQEVKRAKDAKRALRMEFKEGYAAQVQFRLASMRLNQALRDGIVTTAQHTSQLARLQTVLQQTGAAGQLAGRRMSGTGMAIQQVGYQAGDFFVQIQGGTNFLVAFGQQATQLVGILPMVASNLGLTMGTAIGLSAGLGILIPIVTAVGAVIMRAGDTSKKTKSAFEGLKDAVSSYSDVITPLRDSQESLNNTFGEFAGFAKEALANLKEANAIKLDDRISSIANSIASLTGNVTLVNKKIRDFLDLDSRVSGGMKGADSFISAMSELDSAQGVEAQLAALRGVAEVFTKLTGDYSGLNQAQRDFIDGIETAILDLSKLGGSDALSKGVETYKENLELALDVEKERADVVAAIKQSLAEELQVQNQRLLLTQAAMKFGKDSSRYKALEAKFALESFIAEQKKSGILGDNLTKVVDAYKAAQNAASAFDSWSSGMETYKKNLEIALGAEKERATAASNTIADYERQAALQVLAIRYGEDSVQYKKLEETYARAAFIRDQMALGLKGELLASVIAAYDKAVALSGVDMTTNIQSAADAAATLASNFRDALRAAAAVANAQNQLSQMKFEFSAGGQALGKYGGRGGTNDTPITDSRGFVLKEGKFVDPNAKSVRSGGGGGGSKEDPAAKALESYRQLVATYDEVEAKTLKVEAARKTLTEAERLGVITSQQSDEALKEYIKSLGDAKNPMLDLANTASQALSQAFMSIVDGSKSASDAFGDMARTIIKQAFEMAVINPIINSLFGGVSGFSMLPSFFADGGVFSGGGQVKAYASGGVVGGPTYFPMSGNKTGLMGEAGPEAIMPLKRGKDGKLGVATDGGGSQTVTVVQNFSFQANGDESVKKIIAQAAPSISAMAQKGMMDQRRRGGSMKSTFG